MLLKKTWILKNDKCQVLGLRTKSMSGPDECQFKGIYLKIHGFLAILIFLEMIVSSYIFFYVLFYSVKKYFFNKNYFFINSETNEDFIILLVLFYYVFIFLHLIVHIEPRYLAPVNVIPILAYVFFKRSSKD